MNEGINFFVGLDIHKDTIALAICEPGREPSRFVGTIGADAQGVIKTLRKYGTPGDVSVVYEAGPTGYGLHRALTERGYHCEIIAPSLIPHRAGERIKTDRRDCSRLAELSRAGELKAIWVPDEAHEAMRNLWRAREDALAQRLRSRQQLKSFLLRMERRFTGKTSWTKAHHRWLADQRFNQAAEQIALTEYLLAEQLAGERVARLTTALRQATQDWRFGGVVAALRALRGIDTVSAIGLVCEIGDIGRFATARQLMGYLGLVASERSSGASVRRGSITKTGNSHARRLLTEAAWNYRFPAHMSKELQARSEALAPDIRLRLGHRREGRRGRQDPRHRQRDVDAATGHRRGVAGEPSPSTARARRQRDAPGRRRQAGRAARCLRSGEGQHARGAHDASQVRPSHHHGHRRRAHHRSGRRQAPGDRRIVGVGT